MRVFFLKNTLRHFIIVMLALQQRVNMTNNIKLWDDAFHNANARIKALVQAMQALRSRKESRPLAADNYLVICDANLKSRQAKDKLQQQRH